MTSPGEQWLSKLTVFYANQLFEIPTRYSSERGRLRSVSTDPGKLTKIYMLGKGSVEVLIQSSSFSDPFSPVFTGKFEQSSALHRCTIQCTTKMLALKFYLVCRGGY